MNFCLVCKDELLNGGDYCSLACHQIGHRRLTMMPVDDWPDYEDSADDDTFEMADDGEDE